MWRKEKRVTTTPLRHTTSTARATPTRPPRSAAHVNRSHTHPTHTCACKHTPTSARAPTPDRRRGPRTEVNDQSQLKHNNKEHGLRYLEHGIQAP
jgi:hypothetical protein